MRIPSPIVLLLGRAALLGLLAGCSAGAGSQVPTATLALAPHPAATIASLRQVLASHAGATRSSSPAFVDVAAVNAKGGNQTFISAGGAVSVWGVNGRLNALITANLSAPVGVAVDSAENLYVVNNLNANVLVYAKPYTALTFAINDFHQSANAVAVSKTGIVAVTNVYDTVTGGPGSVSIYAKGATSACAVIADPNWSEMAYDAYDAQGNIFVNGLDAAHDKVLIGEISGGCAAKSIRTLKIGTTFQSIGGVQVYGGRLLVADPLGITIYSFGRSGGRALAKLVLPRAWYPIAFAMTTNQQLWTADYFNWAAYDYAYPSGKLLGVHTSTLTDAPTSIAVNPAVSP